MMNLIRKIEFSKLSILFIVSFILIQTMNGYKAWGDNLVSNASESRNHEEFPFNTVVITSQELGSGVYGYDLFDILSVLKIKTGMTVKSSSKELYQTLFSIMPGSSERILVFSSLFSDQMNLTSSIS